MAGVMGICGGLVGPKSGNVEKVLVFKGFLKFFFRGDVKRVIYILACIWAVSRLKK